MASCERCRRFLSHHENFHAEDVSRQPRVESQAAHDLDSSIEEGTLLTESGGNHQTCRPRPPIEQPPGRPADRVSKSSGYNLDPADRYSILPRVPLPHTASTPTCPSELLSILALAEQI